jgi:asparagine synthase (glutamine-hydrolysing)
MSAIAGIIRLDGAPVDQSTVNRMQALLEPYGRDAQARWQGTAATLLRTLLRTTPEDSFDQQPLVDPASGTVLVFDGRLDNRDEVARELALRGSEAEFMPDSALVLRACLRWDTRAVVHLIGDFALACWQPHRRRLWLARDPMGHRPLYWHRHSDFFAFATMPKALFTVPGIPRALCEERLHDYLCLWPTVGPESLFKDIYRVEPGELLLLDGDRITTHRFHQFDPERQIHLPSDDDYLEAFREHLDRAVAVRLRSNGPIASQLSSGFDSSTVTAIAARQLAERGAPLLAYTAVPRAGFDGPVPKGRHADEGPAARALAARFPNIEHILIRPGGTSPIDNLRHDVEALDLPPLNLCNMVWLEAIKTHAAQRGVKVLLNGSRGNFTISHTAGMAHLAGLLGQGEWAAWWREARALKRRHPQRRWRGLLATSLARNLPPVLWSILERIRGGSGKVTDYAPINPAFMAGIQARRRAKKPAGRRDDRPGSDPRRTRIAALNGLDEGEYMAAANTQGLDQRDPTADVRLAEFCLALPDSQYLREGNTRWLLRRLMDGVLPPEILDARTRGLQAADWYEAAGQALPRLREEVASLMRHDAAGDYLDLEALRDAVDNWPESGWETPAIEQTYRLKLLRGLSAGAFLHYLDGRNRLANR